MELLEVPPFTFDPAAQRVAIGGREVVLTHKEFDLAYFLFRRRGEPVSRREVGERIWGHGPAIESRTLDAHVSRVRRKLRLDRYEGWRLASIYGFGYCLRPPALKVAVSQPIPEAWPASSPSS